MKNFTSDGCFSFYLFETVYINSALSLSVAGSLFNIVCLSVLVKPELDSVFNRIRILLATFDLFYLASDALHKGNELYNWNEVVGSASLVILSGCSSGSAYTTVALAAERCYTIRYPVNSGGNNLDVSARRRAFACYFFPVIFFSILHNLADSNTSLSSSFEAYTSGYQPFLIITIVLTILRIVVYISANIYIFLFAQRFRKRNYATPNDNHSTFVLQMMVISFFSIVLHIFWITYLITGLFKDEADERICGLEKGEPVWHKVLFNVTDIIWIFNSASNVFIYSFIGVKFRNVLRQTYHLSSSNSYNTDTVTGENAVTGVSDNSRRRSIPELVKFRHISAKPNVSAIPVIEKPSSNMEASVDIEIME